MSVSWESVFPLVPSSSWYGTAHKLSNLRVVVFWSTSRTNSTTSVHVEYINLDAFGKEQVRGKDCHLLESCFQGIPITHCEGKSFKIADDSAATSIAAVI